MLRPDSEMPWNGLIREPPTLLHHVVVIADRDNRVGCVAFGALADLQRQLDHRVDDFRIELVAQLHPFDR